MPSRITVYGNLAFMHERRSVVFDSIPVRCVAPTRHQYDRAVAAIPKFILLKTRTLTSAHVDIRNNVIAQ